MALGQSGSMFAMGLGAVLAAYGAFSLAMLVASARPLAADVGGVIGSIVLVGLGAWCFLGGRSNLHKSLEECQIRK